MCIRDRYSPPPGAGARPPGTISSSPPKPSKLSRHSTVPASAAMQKTMVLKFCPKTYARPAAKTLPSPGAITQAPKWLLAPGIASGAVQRGRPVSASKARHARVDKGPPPREGRVALTSYRKPILVQTRMQVGGGLLALEGRVQSIRDLCKGVDLEQPERMTLKAVGVDLTAFAPLIQYATGDAWIRSGTAEGALTATIRGQAQGTISGGLAVSRLSVGAQGEKPSPPGDVALMVDIGVDGRTFTINQFNLASPWVRAEAKGTLQAAEKKGRVTGAVGGKATVQLAALARDFGPAPTG